MMAEQEPQKFPLPRKLRKALKLSPHHQGIPMDGEKCKKLGWEVYLDGEWIGTTYLIEGKWSPIL